MPKIIEGNKLTQQPKLTIMKNLLLVLIYLLSGSIANSQHLAFNQNNELSGKMKVSKDAPLFVFENRSIALSQEVENGDKLSHFFGKEVAYKMEQFKNAYVFEDGLRINIEKPIIYKSIKKINKHLTKQVKSAKLNTETAKAELLKFLRISIIIASQPTTSFENALKKAQSTKEQIQLFNSVEIRDM